MSEAASRHWLAQIPDGWSVQRIKHVACFAGGGTPSKAIDAYWNGHIPWVSPKDMKVFRIAATQDYITDDAVANSACSPIPAGSALMVVRSGILQHTIPIAINDVPVCLNQDMKALIPEAQIRSEYLAYLVQGLNDRFREEWVKQGATVESIDHESMANTPIPVPPKNRQDAIVAYLDVETVRIDDLIAAKTRLAELIDESRWSTLSQILSGQSGETVHARTSSPYWTIRPSDWSELRVKFLVDRIEQGWSPQAESGAASPEEWGVLKAGACNGGIFKEEENKTLPSEIAPDISLEIKPLDVLMSRGSGSVDLVGSVALVPANVRPRLMLCDLMYRLTLNESLALPDWFVLVMNVTQVRRQIRASLRGAEGLTRKISIGEINELVVLVPTLAEQQLLVDQCRVINERASNAIEHVTKEIELLQELRSTTITDAVLGRIDVRDHMKN